MDFRGDDRAQALQVGAILLFGFLILSLSLYQASIVPDQNRGVEFNAYQEAASDLTELRNDVITAASKDTTTGTNVKTGAKYPSRSVFVNPGPPNGRLRTTAARNVSIENLTTVNGEATNTRLFVENGVSGRNYSTRDVRFTPNYHNLDAQPMVVTGQQVYRYTGTADGRFIPLSGQSLLQGDRLNLLFITGDLSAGGSTATVMTEPVSASTRTVTVTGDGSDIVLTLGTPTGVSAETWVNKTGESLNASNPRVLDVEPDGDQVRITLDGSRTYRLSLAKVEVRAENDVDNASDPKPAYVLSKTANGTTVTVGERIELRVEVRDAYNNPLSGTTVEFTYPDGSTETVTTDSEGVARISYKPGDSGTKKFTAEITDPTVANAEPTTTFSVEALNSGGNSGSSVGTGGEETWSSDNTERTIATAGGRWTGLDGVNRLLVSDPIFSPTKADGSSAQQSERYYRLVYAITDGQTTYYMAITRSSSGIRYKVSNGKWNSISVQIVKEESDGTSTTSADLNETALNQWYDPGTASSEPINLLEPRGYATDSGSQFRESLTEMKQLLRGDSSNVFIAETHGRSSLNATTVGQPIAYADEFRDDEGGTSAQENASLLPTPEDGKLSNFVGLQQSSGAATIETKNSLGGSEERNLTTTATYGVKTQSVPQYTLELDYAMQTGDESDVEVRFVDGSGSILQTANLSTEITLNQAAEDELKATGTLHVVYAQVGGNKVKITVNYQRVRAE